MRTTVQLLSLDTTQTGLSEKKHVAFMFLFTNIRFRRKARRHEFATISVRAQ